jgi:flagellin
MEIYSNIPAFMVWKNYAYNVNALSNSLARLSSGQRIVNAGDDPSGLALSERLRSQYRNTAAVATNVENKINYLITADAWMQRIMDAMNRMSELAVSANDGTKSAEDRANLQTEFQQMQKEIQRITSGATAAAKYNGLYLFRGGNGVPLSTGGGVKSGFVYLQVGPDGGQIFKEESINLTTTNFALIGSYTYYSYGSINMTLLGSTHRAVRWASLIAGQNLSISTQTLAGSAIDKLNLGINFLSSKQAIIGAEQRRMEITLEGLRDYETNMRAVESRIRNVDVAFEATEFAKYLVLTQVGTAMLAQANALPATVLTLVQ